MSDGWHCTSRVTGVVDGCAVDVDCMLAASKGGNMTILKWLVQRRLPIDARVLTMAAPAGQLNVLVNNDQIMFISIASCEADGRGRYSDT